MSSPRAATTRRAGGSRRPQRGGRSSRPLSGSSSGRGTPATTMAAIATEAGVALKTVYVTFETKSGLLRALWHLLLRGDEDDATVAERAWYREVLEEPDPERQLRLNARNSRIVKERAGALLGVIRSAASVDPDIEALWGRIQTEFYEVQQPIVEALRSQKRAPAGARCDARDRHPLDAQSPRSVAAAGGRPRLDAGGVGAVVRRHRPARSFSRRAPARRRRRRLPARRGRAARGHRADRGRPSARPCGRPRRGSRRPHRSASAGRWPDAP